MNGFEITRPLWLAALAVLPLVVYHCRRSLVQFTRPQRVVSLVVRMLLVVVMVGALCGIKLTGNSPQQFVVFAVDTSTSISKEAADAAGAFVDEALKHAGEGRSAVLKFGDRGSGIGDRASGDERDPDSRLPTPDARLRQGTDIAAAVTAARAAIPSNCVPQIVLLSDGNQTDGDALAAAKAARVPVSTVPLPSCNSEVYVSAVETPAQVRQGDSFQVEVVVRSTHDDEGAIELLCGSQSVAKQQKRVKKGENRFRFRQSVVDLPKATFTARIEGFRDTLPENNQAAAVIFTTPKPRVLLVDSRPDLAEVLEQALGAEHIVAERCRPEDMPESLKELQQYDLLILSNVPAMSVAKKRMEAVEKYVRDFGGGLIVVGGDQSFTPGGYKNTVLEEVLPVWCHIKQDESKPSLAMVLVIDSSGSMKEKDKRPEETSIELAKQATRQAVEKLGPRDKLGIVAFEDKARWVSEIRPCSDKPAVLERIDTIKAGGGTNMYPAMEKAYLALKETFADLKHMIVLTDGLSHPGDFEMLGRNIAASGITVSTVGVGREAAGELLQDIATGGGGRYYHCADAAEIPKIFALETQSAGKVGITEGKSFYVQTPPAAEAFAGLDLGDIPLLGFAQTRPKPNSRLLLAFDSGDPLLVSWQYGQGTSVVFTSDIQQRWAPIWRKSPGFGRFWVRLVRHALRKPKPDPFPLRIRLANRRAYVTLDALGPDGRFLNDVKATLEITDPEAKARLLPSGKAEGGSGFRVQGKSGVGNRESGLRLSPDPQSPSPDARSSIPDPPAPIRLLRVAPGLYAAEFDVPADGAYYLRTTLDYGGRPIHVGRRGLVVGYADELRLRPTDTDLLRQIAKGTGGQYDPPAETIFAPSQRTVPRTTFLWPYFLVAALLIFMADVALKRIDLSRGGGAEGES